MKKSSFTLSLLFTSMLLAACNTSETTTSNDPANEANTSEEAVDTTASAPDVEVNETEEKEQETEEEKVDAPTDNKIEKEPAQPSTTPSEEVASNKTIDFTFNNEAIKAETKPVTSEQLGYTIELADGFTLTSEEPGSDLLFYAADSNYSMRVEYHSAADSSYDSLLATVENLMIASTNNDFETLTIEQSAFDIHKGTQFISVDEASGLQTIGAIFEKGDKIIVLTIFDGPENSLKDAFLQMAYSIQ